MEPVNVVVFLKEFGVGEKTGFVTPKLPTSRKLTAISSVAGEPVPANVVRRRV
jgi:hypothetical protein